MQLAFTAISAPVLGGSALDTRPKPASGQGKSYLSLISDAMRPERVTIHLTDRQFEISAQLDSVIRASILRSFEHEYYL